MAFPVSFFYAGNRIALVETLLIPLQGHHAVVAENGFQSFDCVRSRSCLLPDSLGITSNGCPLFLEVSSLENRQNLRTGQFCVVELPDLCQLAQSAGDGKCVDVAPLDIPEGCVCSLLVISQRDVRFEARTHFPARNWSGRIILSRLNCIKNLLGHSR